MIQNTNYGASKTYVNTKVDKLTTSGLKAYTHDGATQGEIDVSNTYTPATLALRDANGRMQAADPASGATDRSLTTANWISQSGDSAPNNLAHRNGNETWDGEKKASNINNNRITLQTSSGDTGWRKIYEWVGPIAFTALIQGMTGTRRNGGPIIVSVAINNPPLIGDGSSWNAIIKLPIGTTSKQVGIAYNGSTIGFYYLFPQSEVTTIEIIGTVNASNKNIAITPISEDPTTITKHVVV